MRLELVMSGCRLQIVDLVQILAYNIPSNMFSGKIVKLAIVPQASTFAKHLKAVVLFTSDLLKPKNWGCYHGAINYDVNTEVLQTAETLQCLAYSILEHQSSRRYTKTLQL